MFKKVLLVVLIIPFFIMESVAQNNSIRNGISWYDTDGNRIRANGASILQHEGKYYMTGMDFTDGYNGLFSRGIKLYSSTDMMNWTFENVIIKGDANEQLASGERFLVRPNLVYNEETEKFIIWSGYKNPSQTYGAVAIFSSSTVDGNYVFEKEIQPLGYDSNDSCLFVDDDDTAYYISNSKNDNSLNIYKLTSDYMNIASSTPTILFAGLSKEAPVVFKKDGIYYLINSRKTGWNPNQAQYASSLSMTSGWSSLRNFGNRLTYDTQPTTFFTVKGSEATSYFYVGDRWQDPDLRESKIIFTPMEVSNGNLTLNYIPELKINMATGTWEAFDDNQYVPNDNWSLVSISSQENNTTFGAKNVFDNNIRTIWNTRYTSGNDRYPHEMIISLGGEYDISGFMCVPRQDASGNTISDFQLFLSEDGIDWGVPVAAGRMSYWSELYFLPTKARFMKLVGRADLNGSRFASAAEFKLIMSSEYSANREIYPYFNPDGKGWRSGNKVLVERGGQALIGVQTEFGTGQTPFYGSYSYFGPENYYANTRIINLQNITENQLGKYTVTYLDDSFSIKQHTYEVAFTMQTIGLVSEDVDCNGETTGAASIVVEGGFEPYSYSWSDGQETQSAIGLAAGTYEVVVTDNEGNSISESVVIDEPEAIDFDLTEDQQIYLGYGDQCVTLEATEINGGTGEYAFEWSTGEVSSSINVCADVTANYSLKVTDINGCSKIKEVTVNVEDIRCTTNNGEGLSKVQMCIDGQVKCVAINAVPSLLNEGYSLGSCSADSKVIMIYDIDLYPNPTNDYADLKFTSDIKLKGDLSVYNLSGRLMSSVPINVSEGVNHIKVDMSKELPGTYFLAITGVGYHSNTVKLIKN